MTMIHLTESQIQGYVFDYEEKEMVESHLHVCRVCQLQVNNYRLIFQQVENQAPSSFDFVVSDFVLAQLPPKQESKKVDYLIGMLLLAGSLSLLTVLYMVIATATVVVQSMNLWLISIAAVSVFCFHLMGPLKEYGKKMRLLKTL